MSANTEQLRAQLLDSYSSDRWKKRVKEMSEDQIFAIHARLKRQGGLKK